MWVLKIKRGEQNQVQYKAELVARGFQQKEAYNYSEFYITVVILQTVIILPICEIN